MQGAGLERGPFALLEDVLDVLAGERLADDGVINGAGDLVGAVDIGDGDDLVDVRTGVEAAFFELLVVVFGLRAQGVKGLQPLGLTRSATLVEEFADMIGVFKITVSLVAARMGGDQVVGVVEAEPAGERFEGEPLRGVGGGHGVAVGVQDNATTIGDAHEAGDGGVGPLGRQRAQGGLFDLEEFHRGLAGFAMDAHVGDGFQPPPGGGIHRAKAGGDFQSGEEVFLHVADGVFHPAFFVGLAHIAGAGLEAVVRGKVKVARMEACRLAQRMAEHAGLEVVDEDRSRRAAKILQPILVAAEEVLQAFPTGELDVGQARVAEHHDEKRKPTAGCSDLDNASAAPVHLGGFSGFEG